jgi:hypothetical protein
MAWAFSSSTCSGFRRSARIPPWIFGCSVLTRPSSISGDPVTCSTDVTAIPASRRVWAVPPDDTSATPWSASSFANATRSVLS